MAAAEGGAPGGRRGRFVREYLHDLDPEAAARRAGYAPARAAATGQRLLRDPALGAAIRAAWGARAGVSAEAVVRELALIAFADLAEFVDWDGDGVRVRDSRALDAARRRAVVEVRQGPQGVQLKLASKQAALEALARHLGLQERGDRETPLVITNPRTGAGT